MSLQYLSTHRCYASPALSRSSVTLSVGKVGDLEYVEQFGVPVSGALGYVGVAVAVIDDKDEEQDCLHCEGSEDYSQNEQEHSTLKRITCSPQGLLNTNHCVLL